MSELFFIISILMGFLVGTLLIGNLFYFLFVNLPNIIKNKLNGELNSPVSDFLKMAFPSFFWTAISILMLYLISTYFESYLKLFYCGGAIALFFNINAVLKLKRN